MIPIFKGSPLQPPEVLLAIDPGKDTGFCFFRQGMVYGFGICRGLNELIAFLKTTKPPNQLVVESYALFKWKALQQSGSEMEVSQAIGMVKLWAANHEIPMDMQAPRDALKMGHIWSGVPMPKNHRNSHGISALYHGTYWLVKNGMKEVM